ncbi:MAG: AMP-binding protein, partial [Pseudomonadota bacterium]
EEGVRPGDRVLLHLSNGARFPILFFAALGMGAVPVPISAQLSLRELREVHRQVAPRLSCLSGVATTLPGPVLREQAARRFDHMPTRDFATTRADDLGYIVFTSGTSSRPRGVAHAHRAGYARRMMWQGWYGLGPEDVMLHAGAFNWTYTLGTGLTDPWADGATAVVYTGPKDPSIWPKLIERHRATLFAAAPGVYRQMLKAPSQPGQFRTLRHGLSAGESLPDTTRKTWHERTGTEIHEALGMTEISTFVSGAPSRPAPPGSLGYPQPGRRIAVLDQGGSAVPPGTEGILAVHRSDPGLMLGYWRDPSATRAAFVGDWFLTGDRVCQHRDGAITYLGRPEMRLNAGGHRVSAGEVEAVLEAQAGVAAAAVVDLPVGPATSILAAFVEVSDNTFSTDHLARACAAELAAYKRPRQITRVDALPRTATGKLKRKALIDHFGWKDAP